MAMSKEELYQAFREVASLEFAHISFDDSQFQYVFSDKFENRMKTLIHQMNRKGNKKTHDRKEQ